MIASLHFIRSGEFLKIKSVHKNFFVFRFSPEHVFCEPQHSRSEYTHSGKCPDAVRYRKVQIHLAEAKRTLMVLRRPGFASSDPRVSVTRNVAERSTRNSDPLQGDRHRDARPGWLDVPVHRHQVRWHQHGHRLRSVHGLQSAYGRDHRRWQVKSGIGGCRYIDGGKRKPNSGVGGGGP